MKKLFKNLFTSLTIAFSFSVYAEEFTFDSNIKYKKNDSAEFIELKSQQPLLIQAGEKVFVNTAEGIPLIIFSAASNNTKINIPSTQLSMMALEQSMPYFEKTTNEILEGIRAVDRLISKRDYAAALIKITALKDKYKGLSSILFLSGSANYLSNNKAAAIKDLESGLLISPDNTSAKKLLEKVKKEI